MNFQRTLKSDITIKGIGLHSGKEARLTIRPARANFGVSFVRTDLPGSPPIPAHFKNVVSTQLATTLGRGQATVSTVEHVLAALQGLGIDNALIEVDGPEIPILDGSSAIFCEAIEAAGIENQTQGRAFLALRRRVEVRGEDKTGPKWAVAEPSSRLEIHGTIEWNHPAIGSQEYHYIDGKTPFTEIAAARTFCQLKDVEALRRMGLAQGGSLDNAIVLDDRAVLNPGGLRFPDEFVRHKVMDALGDFKLAGISLRAYVRLHRAGHDLHSQLLAEIFRNPDNYEIIDPSAVEEVRPARIRAAIARGWAATF